jgi:hydrogenase maturation protease
LPDLRVAVIGVGNVLYGDDGVGVHAARRLGEEGLPAGTAAYDMGTALMDLPSEVCGCERLVIVDAVRFGGEPGSVYRIEMDQVDEEEAPPPASLHDLGVRQMLSMARLSGMELGPAVLVGVEAVEVSLQERLSQAVRGALPRVLEAVRKEVEAVLAPSEEVRA